MKSSSGKSCQLRLVLLVDSYPIPTKCKDQRLLSAAKSSMTLKSLVIYLDNYITYAEVLMACTELNEQAPMGLLIVCTCCLPMMVR